jgi:hypothetical protein
MNNAIVLNSSPQLDKQLHVNGHIHNAKYQKKTLNSMKNTENRRKICLFDVIWAIIIMASCARWLIWMKNK